MEGYDTGWVVFGRNAQVHRTALFDLGPNWHRIYIGPGCEIGANVIIKSGCKLTERCRISSGVVIEENCEVWDNTFIGHHCVLRPETILGKNCVIGHGTVFEGKSEIGDDTLIHAQNHITKGVTIGKGVFIAPLFVGANDRVMAHMRRDVMEEFYSPYVIEDYVRIAVGVTILPDITLGRNSIIGAHSLVTKNVPPNEKWRGVPAVPYGKVNSIERL